MIVIDASILVDALTDDGAVGDRARSALAEDPHWVAPPHLPVEVLAAVRGRWLAGKLSDERADASASAMSRLAVEYASWPELGARVWELKTNHTSYDAAYIAVAEARRCTLLTADQKLFASDVRRCPVTVVR